MAIDTSFGEVRKFEDFLITAIADRSDIDILANDGGTAEVVGGAADGRMQITLDGDNADDVAACSFGDVNWTAGIGLKMEGRIFIDDITDYKLFIGFGDTIASADETSFSATSDVVTIDTMSNAIGILYDGDSSTDQLWAVAGATDVVTVNKGLANLASLPVAAAGTTWGVYLSTDRKSAQFYVDNKEVYRIDSDTVLVAAVDLVPGVWGYDQGTATTIDIDYLYGSKGRSTS